MEAKELRIGLIVFGKAVGNVTTIMPMDIVASHQCEQAEKEIPFEPVPLTEEWLLKFGFTKSSDDKYYKNSKFTLYRRGGYFGLVGGSPSWNEFEHVHQLQNLYYSLTGEELKILTPV